LNVLHYVKPNHIWHFQVTYHLLFHFQQAKLTKF
jgi:hypothetical protein